MKLAEIKHALVRQDPKILAGIAVLLLSIVGAAVFAINSRSDSELSKENSLSSLTPKTEIKIADNRYVSTCQLITDKDVEEIFGTLAPKAQVFEKYLDTSYDDDGGLAPSTKCEYTGLVNVVADQYFSFDDNKKLTLLVNYTSFVNADATIQGFQNDISQTPNTNADTILSKMKESVGIYTANTTTGYLESKNIDLDTASSADILAETDAVAAIEEQYKALDTAKMNGFIVPDTTRDSVFIVMVNNIKYEISIDKSGSSVEKLDQLKRIYDLIVQRSQDSALDQSPAPTLFNDIDSKFGSTKIIDACAVLTKDIYEQVLGDSDNAPVLRFSMLAGYGDGTYLPTDEDVSGPDTTCQRAYATHIEDDARKSSSMNVKVGMASSVEEAVTGMDKLKSDTKYALVQLETTADDAVLLKDGDSERYVFRTGPYLTVFYGKKYSVNSGDSTNASDYNQESNIQAINLMSASIKQIIAN